MRNGFLKLIHVSKAVGMVLGNLPGPVGRHRDVELASALGRVSSEDVPAPEDIPGFGRSSMDGYAVRAADTFGASEGLPAYLELAGEVLMGSASGAVVEPGKAVRISTGGFMPEGADAVVMVENTELSGGTLEVVEAVAPGDNTIAADEDIRKGAVILAAGQVIAPAQIGSLAGVGITHVNVYDLPVVGIISTGDELVPAGAAPGPGQVRDVNSAALRAAVSRAGCVPENYGIVKDDRDTLAEVARRALDGCDAVLVSGGSSAGVRDITLDVLEDLGRPGLLAHGIYLKPGKPTLVAVCGGKPVIGLPGNPASALAVFRELLAPVLAGLRGERAGPGAFAPRTVEAVIERSVASAGGRVELVPVVLEEDEGGLAAVPIIGKQSLIGTLSRATGQVRIPLGLEGLEKGSVVTVELID